MFNREVDDDFLTVHIDKPAVWHFTYRSPPLIVGTVLSSSAAAQRETLDEHVGNPSVA